MWKYPIQDKVFQFFLNKSIGVPPGTHYALEMNTHWFSRHGINAGDVVVWKPESSKGYIKKLEE